METTPIFTTFICFFFKKMWIIWPMIENNVPTLTYWWLVKVAVIDGAASATPARRWNNTALTMSLRAPACPHRPRGFPSARRALWLVGRESIATAPTRRIRWLSTGLRAKCQVILHCGGYTAKLLKWADTAFCLCRSVYREHVDRFALKSQKAVIAYLNSRQLPPLVLDFQSQRTVLWYIT